MEKIKEHGRVYTPTNIVKNMLDISKYNSKNILRKHIIDNSCGDGAFLVEIVERYCKEFLKENKNLATLKHELETYIHGIELDKNEYLKSIYNVEKIVNKYNIQNVKWDIINDNTLNVHKYNNKMDYVIGNPPYVKLHNISNDLEKIRNMKFSTKGMIDLFIVFYELGINMLNSKGKLVYITPNSINYSIAGAKFRRFVIENKLISEVVNLGHYKPFQKVNTYTSIIVLIKNKYLEKIKFNELTKNGILKIDILNYNDFYIEDKFYFNTKENIKEFKNIIKQEKSKLISVKNGLATLADKIFIDNIPSTISNNKIDILKASTGEHKQIIYPYDENGNIISFDELDLNIKQYLIKNKEKLKDRNLDTHSNWYSYGRSQGIKDIFKNKIAVSSIINDKLNLKIVECPKGVAVYSGLYILGLTLEKVKKLLINEDFFKYVKTLGKYRDGGYYNFSSSDLQKYIIYKITK